MKIEKYVHVSKISLCLSAYLNLFSYFCTRKTSVKCINILTNIKHLKKYYGIFD